MTTALSPTVEGGPGSNRFTRFLDAIARNPGQTFGLFILLHLALWTILPMIVCRNLPLDVLEGVEFGQHWALGYWKHPPLPWWLDNLVREATGPQIWGFFLMGQVAACASFWAIWRLGREILDPLSALAGVVLLDGCMVFNAVTMEVNHNIIQLPFFGLIGWQMYRAFQANRLLDWILTGLWVAIAFYSKYTAAVLMVPIAIFALVDPTARRCFKHPGVYVAVAVFLVLMAPHLVWLVQSDFSPFRYFADNAPVASGVANAVASTLDFTANALLNVLAVLIMFALMLGLAWRWPKPQPIANIFARRYLAVLALGPVGLTIVIDLWRDLQTSWSAQLWCFLGLFLMAFWAPPMNRAAIGRLAGAWALVTLVMIGDVIGGEVFLINPASNMPTQFPACSYYRELTAAWQKETGKPLAYVMGDDFELGSVILCSDGNVAAWRLGDPHFAPWIDEADVRRRGAILLWVSDFPELPLYYDRFKDVAQVQPTITIRRKILGKELVWPMRWAILPPAAP